MIISVPAALNLKFFQIVHFGHFLDRTSHLPQTECIYDTSAYTVSGNSQTLWGPSSPCSPLTTWGTEIQQTHSMTISKLKCNMYKYQCMLGVLTQ